MDHKQAFRLLNICYREKLPLMLWGGHGQGKSTLVREFAESIGAECEVINLAPADPTDLVGMPVADRKHNQTTWLKPSWLREPDHNREVIYFLDEFNRAPTHILQAMLPFILDGKLYIHHRPMATTYAVAACNFTGPEFEVNEMFDQALISRFGHITLEVNSDQWLERNKEDICPYLYRLVNRERRFLDFKGDKTRGFTVEPDPRSLERIGRVLARLTPEEANDDTIIYNIVQTFCGTALAEMYITERCELQGINIRDILDDYTDPEHSVCRRVKYAVLNNRHDTIASLNVNLVGAIDRARTITRQQTNNIAVYLLDIPRESAVYFIKLCIDNNGKTDGLFTGLIRQLGKNEQIMALISEIMSVSKGGV